MTKSFTGAEFVHALAEGTLREPISLEGMVKKHESRTDAVLFAQDMSCVHWTLIPVEMIETVDFIINVPCRDHEHAFVRLTLKETAHSDAASQMFADLLRHVCKPHSSFSTEPIEPTRSFNIFYKCGFVPVFYAKAYSEAQLNSLLAKCNTENGNTCCWRPS